MGIDLPELFTLDFLGRVIDATFAVIDVLHKVTDCFGGAGFDCAAR